jgi:hypothetical protein
VAFKSGKNGTREAALSALSAKPKTKRTTVARPAKKAAPTAKKASTPAKRTAR